MIGKFLKNRTLHVNNDCACEKDATRWFLVQQNWRWFYSPLILFPHVLERWKGEQTRQTAMASLKRVRKLLSSSSSSSNNNKSTQHLLSEMAPLFALLSLLGLLTSFASATALTYKLPPNGKECFYSHIEQKGAKIAFYFAVCSCA